MAGMGDKARPRDEKRYGRNHDAIRWRSKGRKRKGEKK